MTQLTRAIPVGFILPPDPPSNEITDSVAEALRLGFLRNDPIPAITVYPAKHTEPGEWFRLLVGQHRLEGAKRAGRAEIQACIVPEPSTIEKVAIYFRENANRKSLGPIEMASLVTTAMNAGPEKLTGKQVAKLFGISEAAVSKCLAIDKNLHPELKTLVAQLKMVPRAAYIVSRIFPQENQPEFWRLNSARTVDELEDLVSMQSCDKPKEKGASVVVEGVKVTFPPSLEAAASALRKLLETVKVMASKKSPMSDLPFHLRMQG